MIILTIILGFFTAVLDIYFLAGLGAPAALSFWAATFILFGAQRESRHALSFALAGGLALDLIYPAPVFGLFLSAHVLIYLLARKLSYAPFWLTTGLVALIYAAFLRGAELAFNFWQRGVWENSAAVWLSALWQAALTALLAYVIFTLAAKIKILVRRFVLV